MKFNILSVDCDWIINIKQQEELLSFIIPIIYDHTDIVTTYAHNEIYPLFAHGYDEYNLINIDHHHDFHYGYIGKNTTVLDEGNWLFHLSNIFKKKINYTWICNPDSSHIFLKEYKNLKSFSFDHNLDYITTRKFDKIFICCSPDYASNPGVISTYKIIEKIVSQKRTNLSERSKEIIDDLSAKNIKLTHIVEHLDKVIENIVKEKNK